MVGSLYVRSVVALRSLCCEKVLENAELCSVRGESGEGHGGRDQRAISGIRHVNDKAILGADPPDSGTVADAL